MPLSVSREGRKTVHITQGWQEVGSFVLFSSQVLAISRQNESRRTSGAFIRRFHSIGPMENKEDEKTKKYGTAPLTESAAELGDDDHAKVALHSPRGEDGAFLPEAEESEGVLRAEYEALKLELQSLRQKEAELLARQSQAKQKYRLEHPPQSCVAGLHSLSPQQRLLLLKDSAAQMEYVMHSATIPAFKVSEGERIVEANQAFFNYLGLEPEAVYGGKLTLKHVSTPESVALERAHLADFKETLVTRPFETERVSKDGWLKPVMTTLRVTRLEPLEYVAFWLDLTELRYLEDSIKQRNSIFSAIVEEMPHIVFVCNQDGAARQFNRRLYELTGTNGSRDDGYLLEHYMHPQDLESFKRRLSKLAQVQTFSDEYRLRAQDEEYYWHTFRIQPLSLTNGLLDLALTNNLPEETWRQFASEDARLWIGTATDVDRRKRIMDEVLESAQAFQSLANQIPQIVWTAAPDGRIEFLNERWYEFSGHSREHKMGLDFALFIHPEDRREYMNRWKSSVKTGDAFEVDFRLRESDRKKTDDYVRCLARAVALRNYRGEIAQWIGTWTSI